MAEMNRRTRVLSFPNPVDEVSARLVAAGVVGLCLLYLVTGWGPLLLVLSYGFLARVASGPTLSPLGQVVTRVIRPRLAWAVRDAPGPPKRFAQGIGAALSTGSVAAWLLGQTGTAQVLVSAILGAASLEAFVGYCIGCRLFRLLMGTGLIDDAICEACNDIWDRSRV